MDTKAQIDKASSVLDPPDASFPNGYSFPITGLAARYADVLYRPVPPVDVDDDGYPFQDSKMSEGTKHSVVADYFATVLRARYRQQPDVCVGSDLSVFFERGNRAALLAPDLMVAFGAAGRGHRLSYKVWEEGKVPDLALEILSRETWRRDLRVKPNLYRDLGVREFWILDVIDKLPTPIIGRRLGPGGYVDIEPEPSGAFRSEILGLELVAADDEFRLRDPTTGLLIPDYAGREQAQRDAEQRATALEAENAALRRQLGYSDT